MAAVVDVAETGTSKAPPNVANEASSVTAERLAVVVKHYRCLEQYNPVVPTPAQRAHEPPEGKVAVYWRTMEKGNLRMPPTPFFLDILKYYKVGFSQLHPFAVQKVLIFEMWFRSLRLSPSVNVFRACFRMAASGVGWYTFAKKNDFVGKQESVLHDWRDSFFFIDQTVIPNNAVETLVWQYERPKHVSYTPKLTAAEQHLLNACKDAKLEMREYHRYVLVLGCVSSFWPFVKQIPVVQRDGHGTGGGVALLFLFYFFYFYYFG